MLQRYETEAEYTRALHLMRPDMINVFKDFADELLTDEKLVQSFEAKIGCRAEAYAEIKSRSYSSVVENRDAWFRGLINDGEDKFRDMLKNDILREYTILFVERSYVKNPKKYAKLKLEKGDREIYLGDNKNVIGVFIAPRCSEFTGMKWYSYDLKGLKTTYDYLTLGQLKKEGYLKGNIEREDEFEAELVEVNTMKDIELFYSNFMKSGSPFEKEFIDCYLNYIKEQPNWEQIPLLLPEVRWNKTSVHHKYRADYLIINYYTGKRLAIELSPNSTHLCGENIKAEWIRENDKRNSYFFKYNVPTVTFTKAYLKNIQECFNMIKDTLTIPQKQTQSFEEIIKLI